MNRTNNDWPGLDYTWNPVTGCKRGCSYCYARKIHNRFEHSVPFSDIVIHVDRFGDPAKLKKPARIFVGSMSDIEYWPRDLIREIIAICSENKRHTFMFLSKQVLSYDGFEWPNNTMQGITLTGVETMLAQAEWAFRIACYPRPFISFEPTMGKWKTMCLEKIGLVIVGAMTGPGAIPPKPEWIQSIRDGVPEEKIYWKKNIQRYL